MKNRLLIALNFSILFMLIPLRSLGQIPYYQYADNGILMNFHEIENVDFRVFLLYNLNNDDRFYLIADKEPGLFSIVPNEEEDSIGFSDVFESFYQNTFADFSLLSKMDVYDLFPEWKSHIPPTYFTSVMMDISLRKSRVVNNHCVDSDPFCTSDVIVFEAASTSQTANQLESEAFDDGCIGDSFNPSWYHMRINDPGQFIIHMEGRDPDTYVERDIDFCMWGPFTDPTSPCVSQLTSDKIIDCCYSDYFAEDIYLGFQPDDHNHPTTHGNINYHMPESGEYYILMITNYSCQPCVISFTKTEGSGPGTTDCGILPGIVSNDGPYCVGETINLMVNAQEGATYSWSGPNGYTSTLQNPTLSNCTLEMAGTYTCVTTVGSHSVTASTEINVFAVPTANFTANSVCLGNETQFTNTSTTNPANQTMAYEWIFDDGSFSYQENPTHQFTTVGNHSATLTVSCGEGTCTNTLTQSFSVFNSSDTTILDVTACDSYEWYGVTLTETGVYEWLGQTVEGCDSIVMLHLTVNHSDTTYLDIIACESYEWYDTTYLESGIYSYLAQTVEGCDSLLVLSLTVGHAATSDTTLTVCDWYDWNGVTYTATGDYDYQTQTVMGCDSVATLHLTVNYSDTTYLDPVTACEAYEWYGETYTETGVYAHVLDNAMGCDSVLLLNVTVDYEHYQEDVVAVCYSYDWRGETYTESGEYTDIGPNPMGCDTTFVLRLTIGQDETGDTTAFVCDGFQWYEHYCTSTGQYEHMFQTVIGCDSLVTLDLTYAESFTTAYDTVVCDRYPWPSAPNGFLTETGHYLYEGYTSEGCDSIVDMELTVNYTPDLLIDGLSQVAMTTHYGPFYVYYLADSAELSTCAIDWQCSNPDWVMILGSDPFKCTLAPITLGQATLTATTHCQSNCDTTYVFEINATHYGVAENGEDGVLLFPNPADNQVTVQAPQINHIRLFNTLGVPVKEIHCNQTDTIIIDTSDLAQGIYFVEINTSKQSIIRKIFIIK